MDPVPTTKKEVLVFTSLAAVTQFKRECTCRDFYIDRDACTLVGSFTPEQVMIAVDKYGARPTA